MSENRWTEPPDCKAGGIDWQASIAPRRVACTVMDGESMSPNRLGAATWTDIDGGHRRLLAVPIGSCEQHGPHLPLDTDTHVAQALADGLAAADPRIVVTPALGITASGEHGAFAGTLSIGNDALQTVLVELARSADWSDGLIFVNGHGGNITAVDRAVRSLRGEGRRVISWWPRVAGGDAHAGRTETSLMLAIAPHLVRTENLAPGNLEPIGTLAARLRARGVRAVSGNGVLGDPRGANAAEGQTLLDALVSDLVGEVARWSNS